MADSLVLTGVKSVKKHTGDEMLLTRPKRGGDTHALKQWWKTGPGKCYATCTVFDVTVNGNTVKLALDTSASTNVRIDHDGAFNFTFFGVNELKRAALFTDSYELIEHYVFPSISGGKTMTVKPPGAASRPSGGTPADVNVAINGANGISGYVLSGDVSGENAGISITAGGTLTMTNNLNAHPLYIKTQAGAGTDNQVSGVTGQGATNGDVVWDTTGATPGVYYYQCSAHASMNGPITVS